MMRYLVAVGLAFGAVSATELVSPQLASATNFYVDGSCSANGNGTGDGCASSSGGSGAWRDPQSCFSNAQAGDTCYIKNGTYYTSNNGTDNSENGGFSVANSGTSSAPIVFRNYPGHTPTLANCPAGTTSYSTCARPTITAPTRAYITFQGLKVIGGMWIYGASSIVGQGTRGLVIKDNEIVQGWGEVDDGNWAALFIDSQQGALLQNNYIHDVSVLVGGGNQSSGSCIKLYHNADTIVELNTCRTVTIPESQAGGIDDKAQAVRNIHRYNWIEDVNACVRLNNQLNSTGVKIYGNVCISQQRGYGDRPGIRLLTLINGVEVFNNTLVGFGMGVEIQGPTVTGAKIYNNIYANVAANNVEFYLDPQAEDYNTYTSGRQYRIGGSWRSTLSALISGTGFDAHSTEAACQFVSSTDFHLRAGTSCTGAGRVGGVSTGAAVDKGAYGVASCIGQNCAAPPPPPPDGGTAPGAPTGVRIVTSGE